MIVILNLNDFKFFFGLINLGFDIGIFKLRNNPIFKIISGDIEKVGKIFKSNLGINFTIIFKEKFFSTFIDLFSEFV